MSLFITGTGTNVGKTVLTAGLAALFRSRGQSVCVYKPVQTGCTDTEHPEDPRQVLSWTGDIGIHTFCSYCFVEPVAPAVADVHHTIQPRQLLSDFKRLQSAYDVVLVEGAGGVRVPVAKHFDMRDLIRMFQLPVLVVASPWLGSINHTLLTVDALRADRLEVLGVVISGFPESSDDLAVATLPSMLNEWLPVPLLGTVPVFDLQPGVFNRPEGLAAFENLALPELAGMA